MHQHSLKFRKSTVAKMLRPGGPSVKEMASEIGISTKTLYNWKSSLRKNVEESSPKRAQDWSMEQRLQILFQAEKLNENELGAFLRKKGLHSTTLQNWKEEALSEAKKKPQGRPRKDPELVAAQEEIKKLKKDLRRKEKALAEQSALLILQKKVQDLLGEYEDDL